MGDPDLQIRGEGGGAASKIPPPPIFRPFRPYFGLKIREMGPSGPCPGSATDIITFFLFVEEKNTVIEVYTVKVIYGTIYR